MLVCRAQAFVPRAQLAPAGLGASSAGVGTKSDRVLPHHSAQSTRAVALPMNYDGLFSDLEGLQGVLVLTPPRAFLMFHWPEVVQYNETRAAPLTWRRAPMQD